MEKKIFNAPYLKVVEVKNIDVLTASAGYSDVEITTPGGMGAPHRRGANIWSDGESVEDMDF